MAKIPFELPFSSDFRLRYIEKRLPALFFCPQNQDIIIFVIFAFLLF